MNILLNEAIAKLGGLTATGKIFGVSKGVVFQWKSRGQIPASYCPEVQRLTGVCCESLNQTVDWKQMRSLSKSKPRGA